MVLLMSCCNHSIKDVLRITITITIIIIIFVPQVIQILLVLQDILESGLYPGLWFASFAGTGVLFPRSSCDVALYIWTLNTPRRSTSPTIFYTFYQKEVEREREQK